MMFFKPNIGNMKARRNVVELIKAFDYKDWIIQWDALEALVLKESIKWQSINVVKEHP